MRPRLIKIIQIAKRDLALDDPTYRVILRQAGGADSTTAMSAKQLQAVLDRLKAAGFRVRKPGKVIQYTGAPEAEKVRALWRFLHILGLVRNPSEEALRAYVKRISHVDDLVWAHADYERLIETMKKWAMRALPAQVHVLLERAYAMPATPARLELVQRAMKRLRLGEGYDVHWDAWELLRQAIEMEDGDA